MSKSNLTIRNFNNSNIWDYENAFYWLSDPARIQKILSHYELYKLIVDIPGDVLEFGVYKATSLIRFCTLREIFETNSSRKIIGFDTFDAFPDKNLTLESDINFIDHFNVGGKGLDVNEINSIMENKNFNNVELIKGNVFDTVDGYIEENPGFRISLLHLDMDVKEPTEYVLEKLLNRIVPGGIIVLDDYGTVEGETIAIDKFVKDNNLEIKKLPHNYTPCYIQL